MLVWLAMNSWRFILTAGFLGCHKTVFTGCVGLYWGEGVWKDCEVCRTDRFREDDVPMMMAGQVEQRAMGERSGVFCCPLNLILERQRVEPWNHSNSSAPRRIWSLHSDMDKNAALKDARRKRAIKALSAKSKPTSSSFEIKPLKYQRIRCETQRPSVRLHCWERRGAQLQELYRIHAIWMVLTEDTHAQTRRRAASTCVNRLACCQLIQS